MMSGPHFIRPQSIGLSGFGGKAGVLFQAATDGKTVSKFTLHFS